MCSSSMAQFGTAAVGMGMNYSALSTEQMAEQGIANRNERVANALASDALQRGEQEAGAIQLKGSLLQGEQRNALASSGIDLQQSGTARDILANSAAMVAYEKEIARNNAAREAWGYKQQASQIGLQGELTAQKYEGKKAGTILAGFGGMLGSMGGGGGSGFGG